MERLLIALSFCVSAGAQTGVLTDRYDTYRTGWNRNEQSLNTTNVAPSTFGKLYSYSVDGSVYAQPLYVSNVAIPGNGTHNVLYVVTMSDSIYAFDASRNLVLWHTSLVDPANGITPIPISDITGSNDLNIVGSVGIESTPVIDIATNTMYLVARTKEVTSNATNYVQRLHAVDINTGAEKFGGPVTITGSVSGTGEESSNGTVAFDPFWENQRSGLALANGQVIIMWASHEDDQPYHGWVMAYSASTLAQTGIFCVTPNGSEGGIWMSGRAPVIDPSGNAYLITGNGTDDQQRDFGESFLRLSTANGALAVTDYFVASNFSSLNAGDTDLGSSGPLLIPGANLLIGGGKQGILYLLNPASLGHYAPDDAQIPQKFQAVNNLIFSGPTYWQSESKGQLIYIWAENDVMKAYQFNGSTFNTTPVIQSSVQSSIGANPGGTLTVSSSGSTDASGIVWASMTISGDEYHGVTPGMHAVDAGALTSGPILNGATANGNHGVPDWTRPLPPPSGTREQDTMMELSSRTGGRAYRNRNDFDQAVRDAVADASVTYNIGFYPSSKASDGKFHKLALKIDRPGLNLRYRNGYYDTAQSGTTGKSEIDDAVWSPLDSTSIPLVVQLKALPEPGRWDVLVKIDANNIRLEPSGDRWKGTMEMLFVQKDEHDNRYNGVSYTVELNPKNEGYQKILNYGAIYRQAIEKSVRASELRVVVRDSSTGNIGSVTVPFAQLDR